MSSIAPPVTPLSPGDWVHRYELLYPVAQGGMGAVWAARLQSMNSFEKLFAVKLILAQYASNPEFRGMFLDEARIAASIVHPNIAQVIDLGEQNGLLYIVMEWLEGDSLNVLHRDAVSRGGLLPLGMVLRLTADACAGLHAAHELRDAEGALLDVVHRDISPQNLFVTGGGVLKIIDFGIAKARHRINETSAGVLKGKIHYMAPEQAAGLQVDRRADLWSMGAMLYYLATGRHAFDGPNDVATLHALMSPRGRAPLPPSVPRPVAAIIDRAMTFDPADRFATALDMKVAIETAIDTIGTRVKTETIESYCREHLAARFEKRKQSLSLGKRAAEERRAMRQVLEARANVETASTSGVNKGEFIARAIASNHAQPSSLAGSKSSGMVTLSAALPADAMVTVDETLSSSVLTAQAGAPTRARHRAIWAGVVAIGLALVVTFAARTLSRPSVASNDRPVGPFVEARAASNAELPELERRADPALASNVVAPVEPSTLVPPNSEALNELPAQAPSARGVRRFISPRTPGLPPRTTKRVVTDTAIEDRK